MKIKNLYILFFIMFLSCMKNEKPNLKDCEKSHLQNIKLLQNSQMEETQKNEVLKNITDIKFTKMIIETCLKEKTKKQIECELNAKKFVDLKKCHVFMNK